MKSFHLRIRRKVLMLTWGLMKLTLSLPAVHNGKFKITVNKKNQILILTILKKTNINSTRKYAILSLEC